MLQLAVAVMSLALLVVLATLRAGIRLAAGLEQIQAVQLLVLRGLVTARAAVRRVAEAGNPGYFEFLPV